MTEINDTIQTQLIEWRREFHQYAEPGWLEMRTTSRLARILTEMGYLVHLGAEVCDADARMGLPDAHTLEAHYQWALEHGGDPEFLPYIKNGMTGVITELDCGQGPTVLLRFDIDALGVCESKKSEHLPYREGFCSGTEGIMHACGHDGHMAIGLGTAKWMMEHRDQLHGRFLILFQPAEEGVRGSRAVVEGYLKRNHIKLDYAIAGHIKPNTVLVDADAAIIASGYKAALATTKIDATFHGLATHAGLTPQEGHNALLAAATAVVNLHAMPRYGSTPTQINVGTLHAGTGRNVVCAEAKIEAEVRGETTEACDYLDDYAVRIIRGAAQMHGCTVDIEHVGKCPEFENSIELIDRTTDVLSKIGLHVITLHENRSWSEDFAYYAQKAASDGGQAILIELPTDCPASNHNEKFDFNEDVLATGVQVFTSLAGHLSLT